MGAHSLEKSSTAVHLARLGVIGKSPLAPGTVATFCAGIPSAYFLSFFPLIEGVIIVFLLILLSFYVADRAEKELQRHDPPEVVIDELVGYLVTMIGLEATAKTLLLGFFAFRLFDIWKPWPVNLLQTRLKGGVAVVMDDVAAGFYAMALVWVILRFWP